MTGPVWTRCSFQLSSWSDIDNQPNQRARYLLLSHGHVDVTVRCPELTLVLPAIKTSSITLRSQLTDVTNVIYGRTKSQENLNDDGWQSSLSSNNACKTVHDYLRPRSAALVYVCLWNRQMSANTVSSADSITVAKLFLVSGSYVTKIVKIRFKTAI